MSICYKVAISFLLIGSCPTLSWSQIRFEDYFYEKTMRFDYYHAGDAHTENFFFDEIIEEPYWAGNKEYLTEPHDIGNLMYKIRDKESGKVIYSRGYSTLFSEWRMTPEARTIPRCMPEGVVFPYPKKDVILEIYVRHTESGRYEQKFQQEIDIDNYFIRKSRPQFSTFDVHYSSHPSKCVDIVLLADGYTEEEKDSFKQACQEFTKALFAYAPYDRLQKHFNIRAVWTPSAESGVSIPGEYMWKNTALQAHYYTLYSERYQMIEDYQRLLDAAAHVPYEIIYVLTNSQKYGGGGIYNFYGISAACIPGPSTRRTYSHEFGHLFAGLADEYVGGTEMSDLYPAQVEPWEPNITTLANFAEKEWKDLLGDKPVPTPCKESTWELNPQNPEATDYNPNKPWDLGVYEGGGYVAKDVYRPWPNCMMNWFHRIDTYCPVCVRAIERTIEKYTQEEIVPRQD